MNIAGGQRGGGGEGFSSDPDLISLLSPNVSGHVLIFDCNGHLCATAGQCWVDKC